MIRADQTDQNGKSDDDWRGERLIRGQRPSQQYNPAGSISQKIARVISAKKSKESKP